MIYEYECATCNQIFDLNRSMERRNQPATCPGCGNTRCQKMISLPTIHFFGSGWSTKKTPSIPSNRHQAGLMLEGTTNYD
jgi:putative FmdB family regulatory protein